MVRVWTSYISDIGRAYPMYALSIFQTNDVDSSIDPLDLLPSQIINQLIEVNNPCGVGGITPRTLSIWTSDGANFLVTYPQPYDEPLASFLTVNTSVQAFEFIGERIRYGRLRRMLDNVRS